MSSIRTTLAGTQAGAAATPLRVAPRAPGGTALRAPPRQLRRAIARPGRQMQTPGPGPSHGGVGRRYSKRRASVARSARSHSSGATQAHHPIQRASFTVSLVLPAAAEVRDRRSRLHPGTPCRMPIQWMLCQMRARQSQPLRFGSSGRRLRRRLVQSSWVAHRDSATVAQASTICGGQVQSAGQNQYSRGGQLGASALRQRRIAFSDTGNERIRCCH